MHGQNHIKCVFIYWFGRGCHLNAGVRSDFVSVVNALHADVYVAINVIGFFLCVCVCVVTVRAVT